jgi:lysozyme family protein
MPRTPYDAISHSIFSWEGLWENNPADKGNWVGRRLVGTMRGITPLAYAKFFGKDPSLVTADELKTKVTLDLATRIGLALYYHGTPTEQIPWGPTAEVMLDCGYNSGPTRAARLLQRSLGVNDDGAIGPGTLTAYHDALAKDGPAVLVNRYTACRSTFLRSISQPGTPDEKFRDGWLRRSDYYRATNGPWWNLWKGNM